MSVSLTCCTPEQRTQESQTNVVHFIQTTLASTSTSASASASASVCQISNSVATCLPHFISFLRMRERLAERGRDRKREREGGSCGCLYNSCVTSENFILVVYAWCLIELNWCPCPPWLWLWFRCRFPFPLTDPIRCRLLSLLVFGFCGYETNLFASPACVCVRLSVRVHVPVCVSVHKVLIYFKL